MRAMVRARCRLHAMLQTRWRCWRALVAEQRSSESLAALVCLQSWARVIVAKRVRAEFRVQCSATRVQAVWRGFFCRKMLRRQDRYHRYSRASGSIQRAFRSHIFRRELRVWLVTNRAARVVTRCVRHYCVKQRLERVWLKRLARFHAAIAIQLWFRVRMRCIRRTRMRKKMLGSAMSVLQRFFKRARFLLLFGRRVHVLLQKKTRAAQTLQTAYRAKVARAKFHALKDTLEAQKRDEMLRAMWENAYATSIQAWWRKSRCARQQSSERVRRTDTRTSQSDNDDGGGDVGEGDNDDTGSCITRSNDTTCDNGGHDGKSD